MKRRSRMPWLLVVAGMMAATQARAQKPWPQSSSAQWIAMPASTARDGAETDGSKPMPIFRREFQVRGVVTHAELRIAGLGQFHVRVGSTGGSIVVGHRGLHQAWTNYRKTIAYETYDVTSAMTPGPHALAVMLGNGMYNVQRSLMANGKPRYTKFEGSFGAPQLIAELRLTYADGRSESVATGAQWKSAPGPVVFASTYGGEDFDARREPSGWERAGFDDSAWAAAKTVAGPGGTLIAAIAPEVEEATAHPPVKATDIAPGRTLYDLGQNFAGVASIGVHGPAGATLKLTPGELLKPDGTVTQTSSGGPMWWTYTLRGAPEGETWEPQFGFYGFRYVQAEWSGVTPGADTRIDQLTGHEWHSASPVTGSFSSSSEILNAIHRLIVAAMHNNEMSIFIDCPHREKLGWLEETHLVAPGLMFNNDLRGLFAASDRNMADAQHDDGDVPTIAPQYTVFGGKYAIYDDSPEWGSASILAPWAAFRFYGDTARLQRAYPTMQQYIAFLERKANEGIVGYGLGDWYDIGPGNPGFSKLTTLGVTGTLILYEDAVAMQQIATLLRHKADAARYAALAERERLAFTTRFFNASTAVYDQGSQTAQAMPLALGIVPAGARAAVLAHLIEDIHQHNDHVTTGEVGFPYLVRALLQSGRSDVLLAILLRKDAPSYFSQIAAGATALTEAWDANPRSSQDHLMLGHAEEWFYRGLGGIDFDRSRAAGEQITIRPQIVAGVDWVKCGFDSSLGHIESDWKSAGGKVSFEITIPDGARATIILPGSTQAAGPGTHTFTSAAPPAIDSLR